MDGSTSRDELRQRLTDQQYAVTQEGATEAPFSGRYVHRGADGTYRCVCCDAALFRSDEQYDSGSGWPSFTDPASVDAVSTRPDFELGYERTEVRCAGCDAHLGHVFPDGPGRSGLRYCINSVALQLDGDGS